VFEIFVGKEVRKIGISVAPALLETRIEKVRDGKKLSCNKTKKSET